MYIEYRVLYLFVIDFILLIIKYLYLKIFPVLVCSNIL